MGEMSHHFTSNTISTSRWCNECKRQTQHSVSSNRLGRCMEHGGGAIEAPQALLLSPNSVEIPAPCQCSKYPFAHYHEDNSDMARRGRWEAAKRGRL